MANEKLILIGFLSAVIDLISGFILSLSGIPDPLDLLTSTGINIINATKNALPSNAPSLAYTAANNGLGALSAIRFVDFSVAFLPIAIGLGCLIGFLVTRNDD